MSPIYTSYRFCQANLLGGGRDSKKFKKGGRDSFHRVVSGDVGVARWTWVIWVILTKLTGLALHKTGYTLMPPTRPYPPFTVSYC